MWCWQGGCERHRVYERPGFGDRPRMLDLGSGWRELEDRRERSHRQGLPMVCLVRPEGPDELLGALDVPQIDVTFVEVANGLSNTGVMGLGEVAHVASTAAVACAVYDALGVPVRSLPITPDRVLAALGRA